MTKSLCESLRHHPAYPRIYRLYHNALKDWWASRAIQNAAETLGMDERAYADSRIRANQFSWVATNTTGALTQEHFDEAFRHARGEMFGG